MPSVKKLCMPSLSGLYMPSLSQDPFLEAGISVPDELPYLRLLHQPQKVFTLSDLWSLIYDLWYLISQRWEDCKNKLNEKHLLKPADPQEALCVLDISQSVGEVIFKCYNSTDNYCPGSRRHWDHQVPRQQHRLVVEVSPKANHSLPDSSTPSQGWCHCSLCCAQKN